MTEAIEGSKIREIIEAGGLVARTREKLAKGQ